MVMHERRGNQELDADEQEEDPALVLPGMLRERKSVRGEHEGKHGEDK